MLKLKGKKGADLMTRHWKGKIEHEKFSGNVEVTIYEEEKFEFGEWYGTGELTQINSNSLSPIELLEPIDTNIGKLFMTLNPKDNTFEVKGAGKLNI